MFPRLLKAYTEFGYSVHCGNNSCFCATIIDTDGIEAQIGGGISISDIAFFFGLASIYQPGRILAIGNAFGYGSCCLAEIFSKATIDVIDAEVEGEFNKGGSELTRKISSRYYDDRINLQTGSSPDDLGRCFEQCKYDLIFIDGDHTNEQQLKDYYGIQPFANQSCVVYLHDVELMNIQESYETIKNNKDSFKCYNIDFTTFGCKALVRDNEEVESWFKTIDQSPNKDYRNPIPTLRAYELIR
jgi:predicted O-methyltransferase YrrM